MFKKIYKWVLLSSEDPRNTSLSVQMALLAIVPYLVNLVTAACGLGLACLLVDESSLNIVVEIMSNIVFWTLSIVSGFGFLYGFGRKLWLSFIGENKVVADWIEEERYL